MDNIPSDNTTDNSIEQPTYCDICDKSFGSKYYLEHHKLTKSHIKKESKQKTY